jgi:predicted HD superfamily hydrolase involved in NAD metabolism
LTERSVFPQERRALEYISANIDPTLAEHLIGTRDFALEINRDQKLGLNEESVALASLCHDLARHTPPDAIISALESRGTDLSAYGFVVPVLYHGVLSAEIARERIGVADDTVLDAIRWHAGGKPDMSMLARLVYVADKVEPSRRYPGVEELRSLVRSGMERAFPGILGSVISYIVARNRPLDYNSVAAYNQAIEALDVPVSGSQPGTLECDK